MGDGQGGGEGQGGGTPAGQVPAGGGEGSAVPYQRFSEVVAQKNALAQQLKELQDGGDTRVKEELTKAEKAWADKVEAERAAWESERAFLRVGLTDEDGQAVAETLWNRIPKDKRPDGGMAAWLAALKADPTTAPKALQPYLGDGAPGTQEPPDKRRPGPPPTPSERPPPDGGVVTAEAIKEATERARISGDWSEVHKLNAALQAEIRRR